MAYKGFKPTNGFDKDPKRASLAGKKSSTALPPDLKQARAENAKQIEAIIYKYMDSTVEELKSAFSNPKTCSKELIVIQILMTAIKEADEKRFDFILNRTIGKVVEKIDHTVESRPSILVKKDGTEVLFTNSPIDKEDKDG